MGNKQGEIFIKFGVELAFLLDCCLPLCDLALDCAVRDLDVTDFHNPDLDGPKGPDLLWVCHLHDLGPRFTHSNIQ